MKARLMVLPVLLMLLGAGSVFAGTHVFVGLGVGPAYGYYAAPPCPGPGYYWVDGYWFWSGPHRYWHRGYWAPPRFYGGYGYYGRGFRGGWDHDRGWHRGWDHDRGRGWDRGRGHDRGRDGWHR